jgi:hypothetical protein
MSRVRQCAAVRRQCAPRTGESARVSAPVRVYKTRTRAHTHTGTPARSIQFAGRALNRPYPRPEKRGGEEPGGWRGSVALASPCFCVARPVRPAGSALAVIW